MILKEKRSEDETYGPEMLTLCASTLTQPEVLTLSRIFCFSTHFSHQRLQRYVYGQKKAQQDIQFHNVRKIIEILTSNKVL